MSEVANKIDRFLNSILLLSENQHEILVGSCTSGVSLTNTQEHILMLVADEALTNSVLAKTELVRASSATSIKICSWVLVNETPLVQEPTKISC